MCTRININMYRKSLSIFICFGLFLFGLAVGDNNSQLDNADIIKHGGS